MIRHTALWEIVGTDFLRTVAGTDLAAALCCLCILLFLKLNIIELGAQEAEGLFLILKLGFLRLAVDYDSCGNMGKTHGRVCGIYTLPAVSGGTHYVDAAVIHINLYVYILSLRHHGYRRCGSMDSSAGLCLRHTLYPVHAALVFQLGVCALSRNHGYHFLKAADPVFI